MKMKLNLLLAAAVSSNLFAQQATNSPPLPLDAPAPAPIATSAPATNHPSAKPVKKKAKKSTAKKPAARHGAATAASEVKSTPLVPGPSVVVATHVNVRTRPGLSGEVLTKLTNGEPILVIEEIKLRRSGPEEPSAWAKIALPEQTHAWIKSSFIDAATKTVTAKKLNLRGGPGEAYGVIGQLQKGDVVTEIETKGEWVQIAAPAGAYAFVAAQYLSQDSSVLAAAGINPPGGVAAASTAPAPPLTSEPVATNPPPTQATVTETPVAAAATTDNPPPISATAQIISNELAAALSSPLSQPPQPPAADTPPPPRIVSHEGIVRGNTSIQSPTKFELISADDRHLINYLYTSSKNLDLNRYKGLHIIVTGEEGLDERWKFTPIITIQKIQVLD